MRIAQPMAGEAAERPETPKIDARPLAPWHIGRGEVVLINLPAEMHNVADVAGRDEMLCMHDGRILDVIVAKQRAASGVLGSCRHRLRLIERQRHRLLAPDMLAGFEKGDRHLAMDI